VIALNCKDHNRLKGWEHLFVVENNVRWGYGKYADLAKAMEHEMTECWS